MQLMPHISFSVLKFATAFLFVVLSYKHLQPRNRQAFQINAVVNQLAYTDYGGCRVAGHPVTYYPLVVTTEPWIELTG